MSVGVGTRSPRQISAVFETKFYRRWGIAVTPTRLINSLEDDPDHQIKMFNRYKSGVNQDQTKKFLPKI